jgi:hypothetical protein
VVSCFGDVPAAVKAQAALLDASLAASIKRYTPSEFGSDTTDGHVKSYPFFAAKVQHQQHLRQVSATNEDFSYSLLNTGPFLYRELSTVPSIINVGARTAEANVTHNRALCSRVLKSPTYCDWPCYAYSSTVATFRLASLAPQPSGT